MTATSGTVGFDHKLILHRETESVTAGHGNYLDFEWFSVYVDRVDPYAGPLVKFRYEEDAAQWIMERQP